MAIQESTNAPYPIKDLTLRQMQNVFGDSGTQRYSGYFFEEDNAEWRDEQRIDNVETMRRTDATVQAVLSALKTPILSTEWRIESEDEEIRQFVEDNLFGMERTWKEFLREALAYLDFGHYVFEIIYKVEDGQVKLKDLSPRIPRSIQDWQVNGFFYGITQQIRTDDPSAPLSNVDIPSEKLLVLTNEKEGDDVTGRSVLRSAWKHFSFKDVLYRVQAIAAERYGVGVPTIYMKSGFSDEQKGEAEEMVKNLRSNEKSFMVIPWSKEDGEVEILTPTANTQGSSIEAAIKHHDREILQSVLAGFLGLGADSAGSFALSRDQSGFFLNNVQEKAQYVVEQINRQVINRLVKINFGVDAAKAELKFNPLGEVDSKELSEVLKNLLDSGVVQKDAALEKWVRSTLQLPELSDEELARREENQETEKQKEEEQKQFDRQQIVNKNNFDKELVKKKGADSKDDEQLVSLQEHPFKPFRDFTKVEERVDFRLLNETFNKVETSLEKDLTATLKKELDRYLERATRRLENDDIAGLAALILTGITQMTRAVSTAIAQGFEVGKRTASKETKTKEPATPRTQTQLKRFDAQDTAETIAFEVEKTGRDTISNGIAAGATTAVIIRQTKKNMVDKASNMVAQASGTVVGQNVNRGRRLVFTKNIDKIVAFQRSEIIDSRTCNVCMSIDQRVVKPNDPFLSLDLVHTNCRGVWVPIFKEDEKPKFSPIPKTVDKTFDKIGNKPTINSFKQLKKPINKGNEKVQKQIKKELK